MRQYETVFIIRPELEEEKIIEVIDRFKTLVESNGGEVTSIDKWGKRRLAYEIDHTKEGFYVVSKFKAQSEVADEIDRVFKIADEILRHIVIREDN